eukprot:jgi/Chlat1/5575/Chrsp369S05365
MADSKRFSGKVFLVTGASSGISACVAEHLAADGAHVWLAARREERLSALPTVHKLDIRDHAAVDECVAAIVKKHGKLDGAWNGANIGGKSGTLEAYDMANFADIHATNVIGTAACIKAEMKQMRAQGYGTIVNNSSVASTKAMPHMSAFVSSKHALEGLMKCAALEIAAAGVRINNIDAGYVYPSEMFTNFVDKLPKMGLTEEWFLEKLPQRRFTTPDEVANAALFLLDDRLASGVTGQSISVCGGMGLNQFSGTSSLKR